MMWSVGGGGGSSSSSSGRAMAQAVGHRPLTAETRGQWQASPYYMCNGQSDIGLGFSFRRVRKIAQRDC